MSLKPESTVDPQTVKWLRMQPSAKSKILSHNPANRLLTMVPSSHGSISAVNPSQFRQNCNVDHWRKSTSKRNCAVPACVVQGPATFQDPEQAANMFEWNEILERVGLTGWEAECDRGGGDGSYEFDYYFKRCWSSGGVLESVENAEEGEEGERGKEHGSWH